MAKSSYRDIIRDTFELDEEEYADLVKRKKILVEVGRNIMGQKIFAEIVPPRTAKRRAAEARPPAKESADGK